MVEYGTSQHNLNLTASGNAITLAEDYIWHRVQLKDLQPNTAYYYRVKTGTQTTPTARFRTQPLEGTATGHYRFIIAGDHQRSSDPITNQRYKRLIDMARKKAEEKYGSPVEDHINLVVNLGDQVDVGTLEQYEKLHIGQSQGLCQNIPFVTVVGNHEYGADSDLSNYFGHFEYDDPAFRYKNLSGAGGEHYYAFQVANVVFVMLNSNESWQHQTDWARSVVTAAEADPAVDWIISDCHHPLYAEQLIGDASSYMKEQILPELLKSDKYAMYLSGHAHLYARGALREEPVYHIINGGASWDQHWGEAPDAEVDYPETQKTIERQIFQIVDIDLDKRELLVETYSIGSSLGEGWNEDVTIDTFYLKRNGMGPEQPAIADVPAEVKLPFDFVGSLYEGDEPYNSTEFQFAGEEGSFDDPALAIKRDFENIFLSTGPPHYIPIDQNAGVDIFRTTLLPQALPQGQNQVRLRYRDKSMHWSAWSEAYPFQVLNGWIEAPIAYYSFTDHIDDESVEGKDFSVPADPKQVFIEDAELGKVLKLDGSSAITIQQGDKASDGLPERIFSVTAWVKFSEVNNKGGLLGLIDDQEEEGLGWNLGVRNNRFTFSLRSDGADAMTHLSDAATVKANEWYHLAAIYDGTQMQLFVNGNLKATSSAQVGKLRFPTGGSLVMGAYQDADEFIGHRGQIDEVRLWQRALTPSEIFDMVYQPEPEPIAHFPYQGNLNDVSDNGKDFSGGRNQGVAFVTDDERGEVALFSGNSWINVQSGNNPGDGLPQQDMTVSTWVKMNTTLSWGGLIGCFQDNGGTEYGWLLGTKGQQFSIALNSINTSTLTYLTDPDQYTPGAWYYVTATYDGENLRLYVNGAEKASTTSQSGPIRYPDTGWVAIGSYKDNNEDFRMNGNLDETIIWGRSLTADEVMELYKNKGLVTSVETTTGKSEGRVPLRIEVQPNPNRGTFQVKLENMLTPSSELQLFNQQGQSVLKKPLSREQKEISIQLDSLAGGTYFLQAKNPVQQKTVPIVIKR